MIDLYFLTLAKTRDAIVIYARLAEQKGFGDVGTTSYERLAIELNDANVSTSRGAEFTAAVVRTKMAELERIGAVSIEKVSRNAFRLCVFSLQKDVATPKSAAREESERVHNDTVRVDFQNETIEQNSEDARAREEEVLINNNINKKINKKATEFSKTEETNSNASTPIASQVSNAASTTLTSQVSDSAPTASTPQVSAVAPAASTSQVSAVAQNPNAAQTPVIPQTLIADAQPSTDELRKRIDWNNPKVAAYRAAIVRQCWEPGINPDLIDRAAALAILKIDGYDSKRVAALLREALDARSRYEFTNGRYGNPTLWKTLCYSVKRVYEGAGWKWTPTRIANEPQPTSTPLVAVGQGTRQDAPNASVASSETASKPAFEYDDEECLGDFERFAQIVARREGIEINEARGRAYAIRLARRGKVGRNG